MNKDLNFIAIDFETANSDYSSICQIGLAFFKNGELANKVSQLINPETHFDGYNIGIHEIHPEDVVDAPTFKEYYPVLFEQINNQVLIHHQPFDWTAFCQACEKHALEFPNSYWLDNAAVVRRTWEQFRQKGYGLKNVASFLGIEFKHHDACEDAIAAGLVFTEACSLTERSIEDWANEVEKKRIKAPRKGPSPQRISGELLKQEISDNIDCNNPFFDKKVVISGTYSNWPDRKVLAKIIKDLGADIDSSIGKKTNILCAGNGVGPAKIKKMQANIEAGCDAKIITEVEVIEMLNEAGVKVDNPIEIDIRLVK
ncbi:exonuclease domain-containing protein [uncultured Sunxiuqinia sp.]|uniref:exonuclease domain-containing protein n=1 Tax=uncultured Sunxiuqinia sp. TaxID=1573825 RepID=UPI00261B18D6|nr:exonuclease domain-containing protein [uncultured Sunxiuqinia sp.]